MLTGKDVILVMWPPYRKDWCFLPSVKEAHFYAGLLLVSNSLRNSWDMMDVREAVVRNVGANHMPGPDSAFGRQPQKHVGTARRVDLPIMPTDSEHPVEVVYFVTHRCGRFQPGQRIHAGTRTPEKIG